MAKKIRVHERALAHLTRGLYRSPASALRELVSNAWDANATRVSIDTNYPNFFQLTITDNGDGFSAEAFELLMSGGIGNSDKRTAPEPLKFGRPTIGRLGIGMLGIAQITGSFTIASRTKVGKGFRAKVHLYDFSKARMDEPQSDLVHDATTKVDGEDILGKIFDVGTWEFEKDFDDLKGPGTTVIADDVVPTFTDAFHESLPIDRPVPHDWREAVIGTLNRESSLHTLGDYWQLLWELAASCPVPYLDGSAVPGGAVKKAHDLLAEHNFSLIVDGRDLFKPIYLKGNPGGYTTRKIPRTKLIVYGKPLVFYGYIAVQEGKQLNPDELRGLMVRIKNVGIGLYDPSMLDYRVNQGPRSRWVTGEIFVEQGLEDALNVDRDSFNRFHPDFRALQNAIHGELQPLFSEVYKKLSSRSDSKRDSLREKREKVLRDLLRSDPEKHVKLGKIAAAFLEENEGLDVTPANSSMWS